MIHHLFSILTLSLWITIQAENVFFSKGSFKKMAFPSGSCFPNISKEIVDVKNKIECCSQCLADPNYCSAFFFEGSTNTCRLADMNFGCNNQPNNSNDYGYIKLGKTFNNKET
jgi:hypothetical protein